MRHRSSRRWTPKLIVTAAVALLALAGVGVAWAFWTSNGAGTASASAATFNPPTNVTASSTAGTGSAGLTWSAASLSTGGGPTGYYVTRVNNSTSATGAACATSPTTLVTATSCTDSGVADGTYHYLVTAVYHSWTAVSGSSNNVTVSNTRPSVTVNQASGQADPARTLPISFTATFSEAVVDFGSAAVTVGGTAPGSRSVTVTGSGPSYTITVNGLTGSGTVTASIAANAVHNANGAGNTASTSTDNTVSYDPVAPSVATPTVTAAVTFGSNPVYLNNEAVTVSSVASDADSGIQSVTYYACPTAAGSCTSGNGTSLGSSSTAAGNYPVTTSALSTEGPYQIIAVALDNAGNTSTSTSILVQVDKTPPTVSRPIVNGHS